MSDVILGKPSRTPWNRNDKRGLIISVVAPLAAAVLVNAIIQAAGWTADDPAYAAVSFNPPGWLVAAIWFVIYPMWGAARWFAYQSGLSGRRASYWVAALMLWGLAYPFITAGSNTGISAGANVVSLGLALAVAAKLRPVSKRAFRYLLASLVWIAFACILGFAALQHA